MRYFLPILAIAMAAAALPHCVNAATIKDCEKIKAADAYNQCLASFGPVAHEHELKPVPAGIGSGKMYGMGHGHHGRYHGHYFAHRHGRQQMMISVAPSDGAQD